MRVAEIAAALGAPFTGDGDLPIERLVAPRAAAGRSDLALAMTPENLEALADSKAGAAIVKRGTKPARADLAATIEASDPRSVLAVLNPLFDPRRRPAPGLHPTAVIGEDVSLGEGVSVGALCVIGPGTRVGAGTVIGAHVTVGADAVIGQNCVLKSGVRVADLTVVGDRVVLNENAVIGGEGFSHIPAALAGTALPRKVHTIGIVRLCDDVEVGANSTVDRATLDETVIGRGTKIDNLVQVGHNVVIGEACLIAALSGISGSTTIGDRVMIGGAVGIADHLRIGSDAVILARAGVTRSIPAGARWFGYPAMPLDRWHEQRVQIGRLKGVSGAVRAHEARLATLEGQARPDGEDA